MKIRLLIVLMNLIVVTNVSTAQRKGEINSVLWQVKRPHSTHTSYLLGTSHDHGAEWLASFPVIDSLLLVSHTFICENILNKDTTFVRQFTLALANEKRTAKELFGKDFDLVNTYFLKNNDESMTVMDTSKTPKANILFAYYYYLNNILGEKWNFKVSKRENMMESMDHVLETKAESQDKEMIGLDNLTHITTVFTSEKFITTLTSGIVGYVQILNSIDINGLKSSATLSWYESMRRYENGDHQYTLNDNYPRILGDELLMKRNSDWMRQLPEQIKTKNCFIAVGAAHLDYKKGLLRELAKQGFILTPVKLKPQNVIN